MFWVRIKGQSHWDQGPFMDIREAESKYREYLASDEMRVVARLFNSRIVIETRDKQEVPPLTPAMIECVQDWLLCSPENTLNLCAGEELGEGRVTFTRNPLRWVKWAWYESAADQYGRQIIRRKES